MGFRSPQTIICQVWGRVTPGQDMNDLQSWRKRLEKNTKYEKNLCFRFIFQLNVAYLNSLFNWGHFCQVRSHCPHEKVNIWKSLNNMRWKLEISNNSTIISGRGVTIELINGSMRSDFGGYSTYGHHRCRRRRNCFWTWTVVQIIDSPTDHWSAPSKFICRIEKCEARISGYHALIYMISIWYDNIKGRPLTDYIDGADQWSVGLSMICPTIYGKKFASVT